MLPPRSISARIVDGSITPKQPESPRPGESFLDDRPACDEAIDDYDHRNYEQDMNQPAPNVHYEESETPQNKEYYRDRPKHDGIPARSDLHLARQKLSLALHPADVRPPSWPGHNMTNGNQHA
jgi:hypothetical protein